MRVPVRSRVPVTAAAWKETGPCASMWEQSTSPSILSPVAATASAPAERTHPQLPAHLGMLQPDAPRDPRAGQVEDAVKPEPGAVEGGKLAVDDANCPHRAVHEAHSRVEPAAFADQRPRDDRARQLKRASNSRPAQPYPGRGAWFGRDAPKKQGRDDLRPDNRRRASARTAEIHPRTAGKRLPQQLFSLSQLSRIHAPIVVPDLLTESGAGARKASHAVPITTVKNSPLRAGRSATATQSNASQGICATGIHDPALVHGEAVAVVTVRLVFGMIARSQSARRRGAWLTQRPVPRRPGMRRCPRAGSRAGRLTDERGDVAR